MSKHRLPAVSRLFEVIELEPLFKHIRNEDDDARSISACARFLRALDFQTAVCERFARN